MSCTRAHGAQKLAGGFWDSLELALGEAHHLFLYGELKGCDDGFEKGWRMIYSKEMSSC